MPVKGVTFTLPGSYGLNTQSDIADDQALRFAATATNGVVDGSGKLTSRKDFVNQTTGLSATINTIFNHRNDDGTETMFSAAGGIIYSGISSLTSRFDYRAGSQTADVGGAKVGATATGLANSAEAYGMLVAVDGGGNQQVTITGSAAQTWTNLITEINADLTGATAAIVGGNLKITSATTGASSTISATNSAGTASNALLTTLTGFVALRTAVAGTTTNNNWQFATLNSRVFFAQKSQALTCLNESTFAVESIVGQPWTTSPNVLLAASGRLWAADDEPGSVRYKVWWSNLLDGKAWNSGDAGSLDLRNVWPRGQDFIVALAMMNDRLIVLGRNSLLLYTLPSDRDPASMTLTDSMAGLGCTARDSVMVVGDALYFLSDNGIYRLPGLAQVTSLLRLEKVSKLVEDNVVSTYASETLAQVRAGYYPQEGWYVLNAPTANKCYCVNTKRAIPELEVPIITPWTNTNMPFRGFAFDKSGNWYCAGTNGVHKYTGYTPDGSSNAYTFEFDTQWLNFGDESRLKNLKSATLVLKAASGQTGTFRWRTDYLAGTTNTISFTCSAVEFAENPGIGEVKVQIGRTGNTAQFGFSFTINGNQVTAHQLRLYATPGTTRIR
jgi:hypothetical protein